MPRIRHTGPVSSILTAKGSGEGKVPEFVAATSVHGSGSLTLDTPAGVQDGDLLLVFSKHYVGGYYNQSGDWRKIGLAGHRDTFFVGEVLAKVASGEGASVTFLNAGSITSVNAMMVAFRGRAKFGGVLELPDIVYSASVNTVVTASRAASRDGLLVIFSCSNGLDVTTPPAGMTQRHTHNGNGRSYLYTQRVRKGDDLSRTIVWASGSQPLTATLLI